MKPNMKKPERRKGSILPLIAVCLAALLACVALGVDLGMLSLTTTECQHAADSIALAMIRSLDGSSDNNEAGAMQNARDVAAEQRVLNVPVDPDTEVTIRHGSYVYNTTDSRFLYEIPRQSPGENLTLVQVDVTRVMPTAFARVMGRNFVTTSATATAIHRPRDVVICCDFSGSMNNESDIWNNEGYLGSLNNSPNNLDPRVPRFGHYSYVPGAGQELLISTVSSGPVGRCNITQSALGVTPMVDNYYQDGGVPAFASAGPGDAEGWVGGDIPLRAGGSTTTGAYIKTVQQIVNQTTFHNGWESSGYDLYYSAAGRPAFNGYIQGPAYYGKTFYIWPPDPRAPVGEPGQTSPAGTPTAGQFVPGDWRRRFFLHSESAAGVRDNGRLYTLSNGNWRNPTTAAGGYRINYRQILQWIKYDGPNPFPPKLQAGRILYYDAIPDDLPAAAYDPNTPSSNLTDQNQRFWREYIDYVVGVWRSPFGNTQTPGNPACSYGPDFQWNAAPNTTVSLSGQPADGRYMNYSDRPRFPRHRFWFGPMTLVQYLSDTGNLPGTSTDISVHSLKLGIQAALQDIKLNYPNTLVSLAMFNRPRFNGEPAEAGRFSKALVSMSSDYDMLIRALWYPVGSTSGQTFRPWDPGIENLARAHGDYMANTGSYYGLMVCHNELSSSQTLRDLGIGGHGREGSDRLVIFETDGMANISGETTSHFNSGESYYNLVHTVSNGVTQSPVANGNNGSFTACSNAVMSVVNRMVADESDMSAGPGFARANSPVTIHCLAFGAVFEPDSASNNSNLVALLQNVSAAGNTVFPSSSTDPDNGYKWIVGTLEERKQRLRTAVMRAMRSGVRVALVPNVIDP